MPLYTRRVRQFPSNQILVPDNTLPMSGGSITESAFPTFDLPDPNDPNNTLSYSFLFWSLTNELVPTQTYTTSVPSADFTHTAWYVQTGGGGVGTPKVSTWAFSHDAGIIIPDNPIDSVTPAAAWNGGTTVDTTNAAVTIDAKNAIGNEDFKQWTIFGNATTSNDDVQAAQDASAWAIAEYLEKVGPPVDPRIFEIREILVRTLQDLIDLKSDPAPIDLMRVREHLSDVESHLSKVKADPATEILERVGTMDKGELRKTSLEVKAQITRLQEAAKAVEKALRGIERGTKKK